MGDIPEPHNHHSVWGQSFGGDAESKPQVALMFGLGSQGELQGV